MHMHESISPWRTPRGELHWNTYKSDLFIYFNLEEWGGKESNHQNKNLNVLLKDLGKRGAHFIFTSHLNAFFILFYASFFSEVNYFSLTSQNISVQGSAEETQCGS